MGIFLILGIVCAIGIILYFAFRDSWEYDGVSIGGAMLAILMVVGIIGCGIGCLAEEAQATIKFENMVEKRDAIYYRLEQIENKENLLVNGGVYDDIVEYNNTIRWYRKWGRSNFWVGCFNPAPIDELEYIDLYKDVS